MVTAAVLEVTKWLVLRIAHSKTSREREREIVNKATIEVGTSSGY